MTKVTNRIKTRLMEELFGKRIEGEKVKPPTFKSVYPEGYNPNNVTKKDMINWVVEFNVGRLERIKPVHFD